MIPADHLDNVLAKLNLSPDPAFIRGTLQSLLHLLMELEVSTMINADHYERSQSRQTYRNGYRKRKLHTSVGTLSLEIPKLRSGTYNPGFLAKASMLQSLITQAYVSPVHHADIERALAAIGICGLRPYQISRIMAHLHDSVAEARHTTIDGDYPNLWLDAVEIRFGSARRFLLIALGFDEDGNWTGLDFELVDDPEDEQAWKALLRRLVARDMNHVELVLSSDMADLRALSYDFWPDALWLYRRMHALQDLLYLISENNKDALVDAVSNLVIPVPRMMLNASSFLSALQWQPVGQTWAA